MAYHLNAAHLEATDSAETKIGERVTPVPLSLSIQIAPPKVKKLGRLLRER